MPTTEACARCAEPKASQTKRPSQRAASCFEKFSDRWLLLRDGSGHFRAGARRRLPARGSWLRLRRRRNRRRIRRACRGVRAGGPRRARACISDRLCPLGRPRCDARTRRAPRSIASFSVGSVSRMRVSSGDRALIERDVEIHANEDSLACQVQVADRRVCSCKVRFRRAASLGVDVCLRAGRGLPCP